VYGWGVRYDWRIGGQREKVKTKGFIQPLALGGCIGFVKSKTLLSQRLNARGMWEKVRGEYRVCRVKDSIEPKAQRARR
jgi:hypothetical protein